MTVEERRWYEQNARGIFTDNKTGQEVALDQRGRPMENPYKNREFDPHGWLQTNKSTFKKNLQKNNKI
jgi:hypothetical protein